MSGNYIILKLLHRSKLLIGGARQFSQTHRQANYPLSMKGRLQPRKSRRHLQSCLACILALATSGNIRLAATDFTDANWTALGLGLDNQVNALALSSSNLYAGGQFTMAGGNAANYIAKWDGSSWSPLTSGVNGQVQAIAVAGTNLYAGGAFTYAGGNLSSHIAKWDGTSWSALGSGFNSTVWALAVSGTNLYAGGSFSYVGGPGDTSQTGVAKWDGTSWSQVARVNTYGGVHALAISGNDLYAGGSFTIIGDALANYIAKWDGTSWSALGSGMNSYVYALAALGNNLYAGGAFTTAGGSTASSIAKWDGTNWAPVGSGTDGHVLALVTWRSNLFAGGTFTFAGSNTANFIAKWDGTNWSSLGSGTVEQPHPYYTTVAALAVSVNDLYAGGYFTTAGATMASNLARAYLLPLPGLALHLAPQNATISWPSADTDDFLLEESDTLPSPAPWITNSTAVSDDGTNKSVTLRALTSSQFFRLRHH